MVCGREQDDSLRAVVPQHPPEVLLVFLSRVLTDDELVELVVTVEPGKGHSIMDFRLAKVAKGPLMVIQSEIFTLRARQDNEDMYAICSLFQALGSLKL